MQFRFNFKRTLQAVAELLKACPAQRMTYTRLLKLLYIADRELMADHAFLITGDQVLAMERGPVPSRTYNLICGQGDGATEWAKFVHKEHYEVVLVSDPCHGRLP